MSIPLINVNEYFPVFEKHIATIWDYKLDSKAKMIDKRFSAIDVRNTYFTQMANVLNNYYCGIVSPFFMTRLVPAFDAGILRNYFPENERNYASNIGFLAEDGYVKVWHDIQKMNLVVGLWIIFEDNIDFIYQQVASEEEKESVKNQYFKKVINLLLPKTLTEEEVVRLKSELYTEYVSVNNKYNFILNKLKENGVTKKELVPIREFLSFYNTLRNSSHYNSRPLKDAEFKTTIGDFKLEKGKHTDFFTFKVLEDCVGEFIRIMIVIRDNLKLDKEIVNTAVHISSMYERQS